MKHELYLRLILVPLALLFSSCISNTENRKSDSDGPEGSKTFIDLELTMDVSFFDYFEGVEIIPLETSPECIIKKSEKLIIVRGDIFILDEQQKTLFLFNGMGKYLKKISNVGSGPGEYLAINDFSINRFNGNIELLDPWGKLHIYSPDLTYLKSLDIDARAVHQFVSLNHDTIVLYTVFEENKILFYSRTTEKIFHRTFSFDEKLKDMPISSMGYSRLQIIGDKVCLFLPYSNIIYDIRDTTVKDVHREWDFGRYNFKPEKIEADQPISYYAQYALKLKDEALSFFSHFELEDIVITRFLFNRKWVNLYYNKKSGKYDCFVKFKEDVFPPIIGFLDEQFAYSVTDIAQISESLNKNILTPEQTSMIESITLEDNPVLLRYRFKKHE